MSLTALRTEFVTIFLFILPYRQSTIAARCLLVMVEIFPSIFNYHLLVEVKTRRKYCRLLLDTLLDQWLL